MGSKTISLDDDAYLRLKQEKKGGESFSDVVKRITSPIKRKSLLEFAGIWDLSVEEWETVQKSRTELPSLFNDIFG